MGKIYAIVITGIVFIAFVIYSFFMIVIPKEAVINSRVQSQIHSMKLEVNKCNEKGGSAYIDGNNIFCIVDPNTVFCAD